MTTQCKAESDVPYTNMKTGQVFWKRERCTCEVYRMGFCLWHFRSDYLEPRARSRQLMKAIQKSGVKL